MRMFKIVTCIYMLPQYLQVQKSKYGKSNNVSADAAFKSQSKREVINVQEASKKPAPGKYASICTIYL